MARLNDLNKQQGGGAPGAPSAGAPPFQRKVGQPFFTAEGLGHAPEGGNPDPEGAAGAPGGGADSPSGPAGAGRPAPVTRAQRLKGGIPANRLAKAMAKVEAQPRPAKRELLAEVSRGARLDLQTWTDVEELAGGQRKMAGWAREALEFVAGQGVAAEALRGEAEAIRQKRELDGGRGRTLVVALGATLKDTAEILSRRTGLAEQAVLEACIGLYHKAHLVALEEGGDETESQAR